MAEAISTAAPLRRLSPLAGLYASGPGVGITALGARTRVSLRAHESARGKLKAVLGFPLPKKPKSTVSKGGLTALWLGPDEWLLIEEGETDLVARLEAAAIDLASVVDVSHRNVAILIEGVAAEATLSEGCPQDLRLTRFTVGAASRTVLGKAEIVLHRTGETRFELECWRSFGEYVWGFLAEAARAPAV